MLHTAAHPEPVPGCFGCKALGLGITTPMSRIPRNPDHLAPVATTDGSSFRRFGRGRRLPAVR